MVQLVGHDKHKGLDLILVSAPSSDKCDSQNIREIPTYGLGILATIAKNAGYNVGVLDAEAQPRASLEKIATSINQYNPRYVGFSSNTPVYLNTLRICSGLDKKIPIIFGGVHASALPKQTAEDLRDKNLYLLIEGPGEDSIVDILSGVPKEQIKGTSYFNEKGYFVQNAKEKIGRFEEYPRVDRSFFINDPIMMGGKKTSFLLASRGCYYNCSFCSIHTTWDQKVMFRELEGILSEIYELHFEGTESFRFLDDLFLVNSKKAKKFYDSLIESELLGKIGWAANSRVDIINRFSYEDLKKLKLSGCTGIGLGLESGNDRILEGIGKGFNCSETKRAVEALAKNGIKTYGYFIIGFPGEDENEIKNTVEFASELSKKYGLRAGIVPYKLYPGSRDYQKIIGSDPSREQIHKLLQFKTADLTSEEDSKEVKRALLERERHTVMHNPDYFNPSEVNPEKIRDYIRNFYLRTRFS